jgi:ribulose-5-phosphate 4-epimerase/fuculose-1-phosphate aldolase
MSADSASIPGASPGGGSERLARDLGDNYSMILRNHGLLCCGRSVPALNSVGVEAMKSKLDSRS